MSPRTPSRPVPAQSLHPAAEAHADTWQEIHAVSQTASHLPKNVRSVQDISPRERDARYTLIHSSRIYRDALKVAAELPALRAAYQRDHAEFKASLDATKEP